MDDNSLSVLYAFGVVLVVFTVISLVKDSWIINQVPDFKAIDTVRLVNGKEICQLEYSKSSGLPQSTLNHWLVAWKLVGVLKTRTDDKYVYYKMGANKP